MASGGHNRKSVSELAASATEREDRLLNADNPGRAHLAELLDDWLFVAAAAVTVIKRKRKGGVTINNAGDQMQKHPAVTVLETASKRIEALVVLVDRFVDPDADDDDDDDDLPPRWRQKAS
jgi:hypothetical protein